MMKVLWFTNTPANSDEYFNNELKGTGGWLKALDIKLQDHVELHIAFYCNSAMDNFKYLNTFYYPIAVKKRNFINKILDRIFTVVISKRDITKYLNIIDDVKPDIIHIHGTEQPFGYVQYYVDIPVVISIQGNITVYKHKYFNGIEKSHFNIISNFFKVLIKNTSFLKDYNRFCMTEFDEQEILKVSKHILGRTDWDRRIAAVFAPDAKYYYVSEILRSLFYKEIVKNNSNLGKFIISTTNGNSIYKGFETLCHSLTILNKSDIGNFEWRVMGISETDSIVKIVKKKLGSKYPTKNLVLLGPLIEADLVSNLLESDLYVMTSHIENSPNNLSEAMILGVPCIATFAGGTSSLITNDNDGILIQDGDPWVMAGAIKEMMFNPIKMSELAISGQQKAKLRHNRDKVCNDLINAYSLILCQSGK